MAILVLAFALTVVLPPDPGVLSDGSTHTLRIGPITLPLAQADPLPYESHQYEPRQYLGLPHQQPLFDTDRLGTDVTLVPGESDIAALERAQPVHTDQIIYAAYLGHDSDDLPYYAYARGTYWGLLGPLFSEGAIGKLGTSYACCLSGPLPEGRYGHPVIDVGKTTYGTLAVIAEWHGLPAETSVVALWLDGSPLEWQVPVSGTAAFRVPAPDGAVQWATVTSESGETVRSPQVDDSLVSLRAYDTAGTELARS